MANEFIQLNRTFHPLSDKPDSDDADVRRLVGVGKPFAWTDLLKLVAGCDPFRSGVRENNRD